MARRLQGCVYRMKRKVKGRSKAFGVYRAKYRNEHGEKVDLVVILPNGERIRDKVVAEAELEKILKGIEWKAAGLVDPHLEAASMPMRVAVAGYIRHLRRHRRGRSHIDQVLSYVKATMKWAGILRLADFNVSNVEKALGIVSDKGRSPRTVNVYRRCCHGLGERAVKNELLSRNPVTVIERRSEAADTRKVRRALTVEEAYRLLDASGPRRLFYSVALWTGLRVGESAALEWRDVDLEVDRPCIRLRAATTKAKRADELPLHSDLAEALQEAKPPFAQPTDRVFETIPSLATFKGRSYSRKRKSVKRQCYRRGDLDRAGIVSEDDQGRTLDLHALRKTFVSWLGLYGVDPRAQISLARHAPQGITMRLYMARLL